MLRDHLEPRWTGPDFPSEEQARRVSDALRALPYTSDENIALHPVVVPTEEHDSHYRVVSRFTRLLERTCWEDGTTPYELLGRIGSTPERHRLLTDSPRERDWAACMSRTDAVLSGGVLRVLECNIGGAIGGPPHIQMMTECHREAFRGSQGTPLYDAPEPFAARHALYARACAEYPGRAPGVALLGSMRDPDYPGRRFFDLEVDYMRARGLAADFLEPEQLLAQDGGLRHPVVLGHFMQLDWDRLGIDLAPVLEAQRRGAHLLAPESAFLLQNKTVLAWMSRGRPWMSGEDRAFLDRHLPWTREVADGPTRYRGEAADLPRLLKEHRNEFVLKPVADYGGHGVVIGCETGRPDWETAVDRALAEGGHVVQEYVLPDSVVVPHLRAPLRRRQDVSVQPVYGFNLFDGRPAGCLIRHAPEDAGGVVNAGLGASINVLMHPAT